MYTDVNNNCISIVLLCREEAEEKARDLRIEEEMDNILNDDFMKDYMQKRMQEMMTSTKSTKM